MAAVFNKNGCFISLFLLKQNEVILSYLSEEFCDCMSQNMFYKMTFCQYICLVLCRLYWNVTLVLSFAVLPRRKFSVLLSEEGEGC